MLTFSKHQECSLFRKTIFHFWVKLIARLKRKYKFWRQRECKETHFVLNATTMTKHGIVKIWKVTSRVNVKTDNENVRSIVCRNRIFSLFIYVVGILGIKSATMSVIFCRHFSLFVVKKNYYKCVWQVTLSALQMLME